MADPTGSGSNGGTTTVVSNPPNPPTTNTVPNTTTNTKTVEFQSSTPQSSTSTSPPIAVSYPGGTYLFNSQAELDAYSQNPNDYASSFVGSGYTVTKITPSVQKQEPTESVFDPGTTYNGPAAQESVFDPRQDPTENIFNPNAALPNPAVTTAAQLNDPYAGLSPTQLQDLGGADPTDPYIRARLGIPQLPGSTLNVTSGFGFGNLTTNFPSIDNALGTIRSLFSGTIGILFSNNVASTTAATTGSGTAALVAPTGPSTALTPVDATTTEGFGVQATVDPTTLEGFGVQATVDPTTLEGYGVPAPLQTRGIRVSSTTLDADQADAYYNGTGTLTADQRLAQDQQTAADAAKLYPGSNNEALRQIDIGAGRIAENEVGIANAEQIVARNNAELADPNISNARRAELLANNEAQQEYIQVATENIAIQENVIEQNANVYAAGGGNEGAGLTTTPVDPTTLEGYGIQATVDPTTLEGFGVQAPVDPTTLEGYGIQATVDPTTLEGFGVPGPDPVDANNSGEGFGNVYPDGFGGFVNGDGQPVDANGSLIPTGNNITESAALVDPGTGGEGFTLGTPDGNGGFIDAAGNPVDANGVPIAAIQPTTYPPEDVAIDGIGVQENGATATPDPNFGFNPDQEEAAAESATRNRAQKQATVQARYKQPGNTDWRVRLSLSPGAQYLYNATPAGVLAPLKAEGGTDGVIFPYTPNITTTYSANYEQYDLVHSNYRGIFYKNSRVGDIQIRGTFTAQNTTEANYLLAVIHFFRSATKMFYGQDEQRGAPPPICLLNGFGGYQFSDHPVVISAFNYTLPNDVDYIRTTNPNNFGLNLNNRYNPAGASLPAGGSLAGLNRLLNAIPGGLNKGAIPTTPSPNTVSGSVTNNTPASYVPTKIEIDVTLIPVQTRSQVSQQFSLKGFANGDLLKGGFW